jgi:uncharacterized membrane protein YedE/YeeE
MNARAIPASVRVVPFGLALGFALSHIGFADYTEVHRMFTFADLRLFMTFACAVLLTALGFALFGGKSSPPSRPLHKGTIVGAALFGLGWAVAGACPGVVLVQIGEGRIVAFVSLAGVIAGAWLYGLVHARYFRWDRGSCAT